jgi:hypothetical protein
MGWFFLFDILKILISQKWQFFAGKKKHFILINKHVKFPSFSPIVFQQKTVNRISMVEKKRHMLPLIHHSCKRRRRNFKLIRSTSIIAVVFPLIHDPQENTTKTKHLEMPDGPSS